MEFKEILRAARERHALTQFDLAVQSGVSLPAIQRYEAGKAHPGWQNLLRLDAVLDLRDAISLSHSACSDETLLDLQELERHIAVA